MLKVMIVTGGTKDQCTYTQWSADADFIIGVDGGALWLLDHHFAIDVAVGDFDTIGVDGTNKLQEAGIRLESFPPEKDYTDTELALEYALTRGATHLCVYGGIGTRFDHSLANVQVAWRYVEQGIRVQIIDYTHVIELVKDQLVIAPTHPYVSLLPFTPAVYGVTLLGFKYPLHDATLRWGQALGVSNEIISTKATICVRDGVLLVIQASE